jgi:hypothetical protein
MQKNGAGLHAASSCFWDNAADGTCLFYFHLLCADIYIYIYMYILSTHFFVREGIELTVADYGMLFLFRVHDVQV